MADTSPTMLELLIVASLRKEKTAPEIIKELVERGIPVVDEDVYTALTRMREHYLIRVFGGVPTREACVYTASANGRGMFRRWSRFIQEAVQLVLESNRDPLLRAAHKDSLKH